MAKELKKRVITSIILFLFIYIAIFFNLYLSLSVLIVISIICWVEFTKMINKIYVNKKEFIVNLILILSAIYLAIFAAISYFLIALDKVYFLYLILICAFSDIGGYVSGKTFKGRKLTKISPNKTISGSVGSFIFSLIPYFIFKFIFLNSNIILLSFTENLLFNILISLFLSMFCQIGDLFISYFKRLSNLKDTGKILPGHGGLLDRIDGIIFAIPSFAFFAYLLNY